MRSTILRKSITDLTRRKARASFTVLTLALAVASIGLFAVPAVMQQAMDREVAANRLADVTLTMKPLRLSGARARGAAAPAQRRRGRAAHHLRDARLRRVAARRGDADRRAGLRRASRPTSWRSPRAAPRAGSRARRGRPTCAAATSRAPRRQIVTADGSVRTLPISGQGRTLGGSSEWDFLTFYAPAQTVASIAGVRRLHVARASPERRQPCAPPSAPSRPSATSCARRRRSPRSATFPPSASLAAIPARPTSSRWRASSTWSRCSR